ncbi:MAG TPA: prepilin-type N-terminal cleavage/methylation domain-containing protein [bacterium]|nr:prepilin-type N-terminal cleavage/methylation domain-containing protein [bacterium]
MFKLDNSQQSFTLIELLVVVAIISILASIALPNYQHAQVKAKVSAAYAEMKTLSTVVEAYALDHNCYPLDGNDHFERDEALFDQARIQKVLTTPLAYISEIPADIFHTKENHTYDPKIARHFQSRPPYPYVYFTRDNFVLNRGTPKGYFIFSFGPDQYFDNDSTAPEDVLKYDPTNGVISMGDLIRKGP